MEKKVTDHPLYKEFKDFEEKIKNLNLKKNPTDVENILKKSLVGLDDIVTKKVY